MGHRAVALAFLAASGLYLVGALQFPFGTAARPGAGFFPVAVGVFLCLVAAAASRVSRVRPSAVHGPSESDNAGAHGRVAATAAGLIGFCLLLPWLGYLTSSFLFLTLLLKRLGAGRWLSVLVVAAAGAAASWYVFAVVLAVPLPRGVLLD